MPGAIPGSCSSASSCRGGCAPNSPTRNARKPWSPPATWTGPSSGPPGSPTAPPPESCGLGHACRSPSATPSAAPTSPSSFSATSKTAPTCSPPRPSPHPDRTWPRQAPGGRPGAGGLGEPARGRTGAPPTSTRPHPCSGEFCTRLEAARGQQQVRKETIMNGEPVVLINAFEVPDGQDEAFLQAWERARAFLSTQEGYLSTRLHQSLSTQRGVPVRQRRPLGVAAGVPGGHLPA